MTFNLLYFAFDFLLFLFRGKCIFCFLSPNTTDKFSFVMELIYPNDFTCWIFFSLSNYSFSLPWNVFFLSLPSLSLSIFIFILCHLYPCRTSSSFYLQPFVDFLSFYFRFLYALIAFFHSICLSCIFQHKVITLYSYFFSFYSFSPPYLPLTNSSFSLCSHLLSVYSALLLVQFQSRYLPLDNAHRNY